MALLPIQLVESFAILDALIDCKPHGICISFSLNCVHDCRSLFSSHLRSSSLTGSDRSTASCYYDCAIAARRSLLHCQSPMLSYFRGVVNLRPSFFGALRYVAHIILLLSY